MTINLIVMILQWVTASFCHYLINFDVKYLHGSLFVNNLSQASAELVAYATSGFLFKALGIRKSFVLAHCLALTGMVALLIYKGDSQFWLSVFIIVSKFGVSCNFATVYLGNQYLFPIEAVVFAYSACNFFARTATILSPEVAELKPDSIAKWVFIFVVLGGLSSIAFLIDK